MTAPAIRRLTYTDLPAVIAIERRAFTAPWSLAMFVLELSKPAAVCLVATVTEPAPGTGRATGGEPAPDAERSPQPGEIAGYLVCSRYDTVWHLMNIAVDPALRRRGVAGALLEALDERIGERARLTLEVRASNVPAIALYERFGLRAAGRRRGYYQDNGEDALIMWRTPDGVPAP